MYIPFEEFKHDSTNDYVYIMQPTNTIITDNSSLSFQKYIGTNDIYINYTYQYIDFNNPAAGKRHVTSSYKNINSQQVEYLDNLNITVYDYNAELNKQYFREVQYAKLDVTEYQDLQKRFSNAQLTPYSYIFELKNIKPTELLNGCNINYEAQLITGAIITTTEIKEGNDISISSYYSILPTRFNDIADFVYTYNLTETNLKNNDSKVSEKTICGYLDDLKFDLNTKKLTLINRRSIRCYK